VLHFFKPKGYAGLAAFLTWYLTKLRLANARIVLDSDDWEGRGGWNEIGDYSWLERRVFAWQERWGMKHCHALTVASKTLEDLALEIGVDEDRVYYLPNGVAFSEEVPDQEAGTRVRAEWGLGDDPVVLLYTRFFEFNHASAIGAFDRVVTEMPSTRLLVVGRGLLGGEEKRFLALAQEAGLASRVACAGWRERSELAGYFASSDLAILPLEDTLLNRARCPAKLVDLMAAELPVVADDVGQVREYIEHMSSGYLVPPGDMDAFAAGVLRLLSDRQLRSRLGKQARRRVMEEFGWHKMAAIAERAYAG
jgi:glycosyltransferase involved in cell wall biosynthesis